MGSTTPFASFTPSWEIPPNYPSLEYNYVYIHGGNPEGKGIVLI